MPQVFANEWVRRGRTGFTRLIAILWLDHALFLANQRCGSVAHTKDDAEVIFRKKVKFGYDSLPDGVRQLFPVKEQTQSEVLFDRIWRACGDFHTLRY
ncbi:hypothetical protein [Tropicimonas marinistellae]|uniref:hypothetical protein n=1 Tax=Tropicimonas marinistellae TaxID=1739787 RepID=UPI000829836A|nr:hypothetical protein [Tropicimonas marinistellae]